MLRDTVSTRINLDLNRYLQLIPPGLFKKCQETQPRQEWILISFGIHSRYHQVYQKVSISLVSTRINLDLYQYPQLIPPGLWESWSQQELILTWINIQCWYHQAYFKSVKRLSFDKNQSWSLSVSTGLSKSVWVSTRIDLKLNRYPQY
jgi:hypothetical protein